MQPSQPQPLTSEQQAFADKIKSVLPDAVVRVIDENLLVETEGFGINPFRGSDYARMELALARALKLPPKPKMTPRRRLRVIDAAVERSLDLSK